MKRSSTETLIAALRVLAADIDQAHRGGAA